MAVLTDEDFDALRARFRSDPATRRLYRESGLRSSQVQAAYQAVEDRWEGDRAGYKSDMDAAAGVTLPNPLAKAIGKFWLQNKAPKE